MIYKYDTRVPIDSDVNNVTNTCNHRQWKSIMLGEMRRHLSNGTFVAAGVLRVTRKLQQRRQFAIHRTADIT